jgi:hypothetical protein
MRKYHFGDTYMGLWRGRAQRICKSQHQRDRYKKAPMSVAARKSNKSKVQAKYDDLLLINQHKLLPEQQYDNVMDEVFELNPDTPKV